MGNDVIERNRHPGRFFCRFCHPGRVICVIYPGVEIDNNYFNSIRPDHEHFLINSRDLLDGGEGVHEESGEEVDAELVEEVGVALAGLQLVLTLHVLGQHAFHHKNYYINNVINTLLFKLNTSL